MNASNNDIDPFEDFFHDRFSEFESDVDEALWAKLEPQLPLPSFSRLMLWHLAAAVVLLLLSFVLLPKLFMNPDYGNNIAQTQGSVQTRLIESSSATGQPEGEWKSSENSKTKLKPELETGALSSEKERLTENTSDILTKSNKRMNTTKSALSSIMESPDVSVASSSLVKKKIAKAGWVVTSKHIKKLQKNPARKSNLENVSDEDYDKIVRSTQSSGDYLSSYEDELAPNLEILASKEPIDLSVRFNKARIKTPPRKSNRYFQPTKAVSMYFSAMPLVNYYTITPNSADNKYVHNIQIDDDNSRIGVYLQAGLKFMLADRLQLKTGLSYTKSSQSISFNVRTDSLVVRSVDNKTADVAFEEQNRSYTMSSHYLGTRVDLEYTFLKGSALSHHVLVGVEGNTSLNGSAAGKINGFVNLGYGVSRQIGDNAYLFIEPTMSIALNHQSDDSALLLVRPNKIGFNIGLNFKIK